MTHPEIQKLQPAIQGDLIATDTHTQQLSFMLFVLITTERSSPQSLPPLTGMDSGHNKMFVATSRNC